MENRESNLGLFFRVLLWVIAALFVLELGLIWGVLPASMRLALPSEWLVEAIVKEEKRQTVAIPAAIPTPSQAKIIIRSLGIVSPIVFPTSVELGDLRQALTQGVAHYPLSAFPHEPTGNVFLFGHSSSRPIERNPARTVFTRLSELEPGADVELWYRERAYAYRVNSVKILKPWEAEVYFATSDRRLTLSTCWPIGDPTNRFVVEAEFVKSSPLPSS